MEGGDGEPSKGAATIHDDEHNPTVDHVQFGRYWQRLRGPISHGARRLVSVNSSAHRISCNISIWYYDRMINQHEIKRDVFACECGDHCFVNLTRGYVMLVSPQDADLAARYKWSALVMTSGLVRAVRRENASGRTFYAHREILGAESGEYVDHINASGIDNRRQNIRICTNSQNIMNTRAQISKKSHTPKGVYFDKTRGTTKRTSAQTARDTC